MKINLIPEVKREQLHIRTVNLIMTNVAIITGVVLIGLLVLISVYIGGRAAQISIVERDTKKLQEELKAYESLEKTVLSIEQGVKEVKQILQNEDKWKQTFAMLEAATPNDIRFRSINIAKDYSVSAELNGKDIRSIDRFIKSFSAHKNNDLNVFNGIDVSGYTTDDKGYVTFSSRFNINPESLTEKGGE